MLFQLSQTRGYIGHGVRDFLELGSHLVHFRAHSDHRPDNFFALLPELLQDKDPEKAKRVMQAMLKMTKIEIAELEEAYATR